MISVLVINYDLRLSSSLEIALRHPDFQAEKYL